MIFDQKKRKRKAYRLSFKIAMAYALLFCCRVVLRNATYQKKLLVLHHKNAIRLRDGLLELNGLFIKAGQLLSIMSKVLPKAYVETLESLQDNTPATDFNQIKNRIEEELGEGIEQLFDTFSENPIASASVGQVHKARLKSGEAVAVKIKHHYIDELAVSDLAIIKQLLKIAARFFKMNGVEDAFEQVEEMILDELDYGIEAHSIHTIKENCREIEGLIIPQLYQAYSTKHILTTSFCNGVKITDTEQIKKWGLDVDELSDRLVYIFCEMIFNHGFYHADPHPGNVLVNEQGNIILLDFGAVAKLDEKMKAEIPMIIKAVALNDQDEMLTILKRMGILSRDTASEKTVRTVIEGITEVLQSGINITQLDANDFMEVHNKHVGKDLRLKELSDALIMPKDWFMLQRTLLLIYGVVSDISEDYDPITTVKPYMQQLFLKRENLQDFILSSLKEQFIYAISLPRKVNKLMDKANRGELAFTLKQDDSKSESQHRQWLFALLAIISFAFAMISKANVWPVYEISFVLSGIVFGLLFLRTAFFR